MNRAWDPIPVHTAIVEILAKKGSLNDSDLYKELESKYNDLSFRALNRTLMQLEIRGVIRVSRLLKKKRMVELASNELEKHK